MDIIHQIALGLGQAAKDWPLATLLIVCGAALVAIPVVMVTKRILDMTWLNRDAYIAMQARHIAAAESESSRWKDAAEKALANERRLVEQASALHVDLANERKKLAEARAREEHLVKDAKAELAKVEQALVSSQGREAELVRGKEELKEALNDSQSSLRVTERYRQAMKGWFERADRDRFFARLAKALEIGNTLGMPEGQNRDLGIRLYELVGINQKYKVW